MAIKFVTTEQEKELKPKYPYFGIHTSGTIVLFNAPKSGIVCFKDESDRALLDVGDYSPDRNEAGFTPIALLRTEG